MLLEYRDQSSKLRGEVEAVKAIKHGTDMDETFAVTGRALREIDHKWAGSVTRSFLEAIREGIQLTMKPIDPGTLPEAPNPDAYGPENMDEYKQDIARAFGRVVEWAGRKRISDAMTETEKDPHHRYMRLQQSLENLVAWMKPVESKTIGMPSGERIVCMDTGQYPGHKVAEIGVHPKDRERAKYLAKINYLADQAGFRIFNPLDGEQGPPTETETPKVENLALETRDDLKNKMGQMTKAQLIALGEEMGKEVNKRMSNPVIIEKLLGAQYDTGEATGQMSESDSAPQPDVTDAGPQ